jgi:hypothetical protein
MFLIVFDMVAKLFTGVDQEATIPGRGQVSAT